MKQLVIAHIDVKEEQLNAFLPLVRNLVKESNKEEGCLAYKLHLEDGKENKFLMYEIYSDIEAVEKHKNSKHFLDFEEKAGKLLNALDVEIFEINK